MAAPKIQVSSEFAESDFKAMLQTSPFTVKQPLHPKKLVTQFVVMRPSTGQQVTMNFTHLNTALNEDEAVVNAEIVR